MSRKRTSPQDTTLNMFASQFEPSSFQRAIFDFIENGQGNGIVNAVAGSGKTTTLVKATERMPEAVQKRTLILAFNRAIAEELKKKVPKEITVATSHSLGRTAILKHLGLEEEPKQWLDHQKTHRLVRFYWSWYLQHEGFGTTEAMDATEELMRYCMLTITPPQDQDAVRALAQRFNVLLRHQDEEIVLKALPRILTWERNGLPERDRNGKQYKPIEAISYDDMVYLPLALKMPVEQYDWVFVDECQDLNMAQFLLSQKAVAPGGRTLYVGDPNQAIYAFIGANAASYDYIKKQTDAKQLPLSVSYRCPLTVVAEAKRFQPQIEAAPNAAEGAVLHVGEATALQMIEVGDAVLCRVNAPLVSIWFDLLARGIPAQILGRDTTGKQILKTLSTIQGYEGFTFSNFRTYTESYRATRIAQLSAENATESQKASLHDMVDALLELYTRSVTRGAHSIDDLRNRVAEMFHKGREKVVLSSIHKAKGKEWKRVFIFKPNLLPHPMAETMEAKQQEENLEYVAITRAQQNLLWVSAPQSQLHALSQSSNQETTM